MQIFVGGAKIINELDYESQYHDEEEEIIKLDSLFLDSYENGKRNYYSKLHLAWIRLH